MGYYSDCWTYPKEEIDALLAKAKAETYTKEQLDELIPNVEEKTGSITIGETAICYGVITLESVTTSNLQQDVELPVSYKDTDYAVIVTNNTFYDANLNVAGIPKNKNTFVLWAKAVSSTQSDAVISWVTIGKIK